ncbi:MAG TPA: hypothetical protein VMB25_02900 [Bryobacteraceae bacterium]|nr:hypothetical protein [Bryobacteraceae bacterium]
MASLFNPVFNQQTAISRAVPQPATDYQVPPVGSNLSLSNIDTTTALSECTGVDCKLIHGERYQYIDGVQTTYISSDFDETVNGNWSLQVNGWTNEVFMGDYTVTCNSDSTTTVVGRSYNHENESQFQWTPEEWMGIGFQFEAVGLEITIALGEITICVVSDITAALVDVTMGAVVLEIKGNHAKETAEKLALESMKIDIGLLQDGVRTLWAGTKMRINGAPDIASAQIPPVLP